MAVFFPSSRRKREQYNIPGYECYSCDLACSFINLDKGISLVFPFQGFPFKLELYLMVVCGSSKEEWKNKGSNSFQLFPVRWFEQGFAWIGIQSVFENFES